MTLKLERIVFKKVNDTPKEADKFIGFHVDKQLGEDFTLGVLNQNISKSSLLRSLVKKWVNRQGGDPIKGVVKRAFLLWQLGGLKPFLFRKYLVSDLRKKRVSQETIEMILNGFNALVLEDADKHEV